MKKEKVLLAIFLAFVFGFIAGSIVAHLTSKNRAEKSVIGFMTQSPPSQEPISIELMEKIEDLKEEVLLDARNLVVWLRLGNIYFDHRKYREATEAYHQYLTIKPFDPDIRTRMGIMLRGLGDVDGAIEEFKKGAEIDPRHGDSRFQLGVVFLQDRRNTREAINAWKDYLEVEPKGERANWVRRELGRLEMLKP